MKKNRILFSVLCLFTLTSCNTQSEIKEYDLSTDENRVLIKDFTLYDAANCARYIKKYRYSTNCFIIDIFHYFGKTSFSLDNFYTEKGFIITASELNPSDRMGESQDFGFPNEKINGKNYNWNIENDYSRPLIPVFVTYESVYTLSEAYNLNYINDETLSNVSDLYFNHLDECKVNIRFASYNSL